MEISPPSSGEIVVIAPYEDTRPEELLTEIFRARRVLCFNCVSTVFKTQWILKLKLKSRLQNLTGINQAI